MITKKAGTILLDLKNKKIGLVNRPRDNCYTFPKGHLEKNETLEQCAIRETEEETLRVNHLLIDKPIYVNKYLTPAGEDVENYMYIAVDGGATTKNIAECDREIFEWVSYSEVENKLGFEDLKGFWNLVKKPIKELLENGGKLTPSIIKELATRPTNY